MDLALNNRQKLICHKTQPTNYIFPDHAPRHYYLFRRFQNNLNGLGWTSSREVEHNLVSYFASKPKESYKRVFDKLVDKWNDVGWLCFIAYQPLRVI